MAKHSVKCAICGETFDTNLIQAVHYGARRYAHLSCDPQNENLVPLGPEADPERQKILEYVAQIFKEPKYAMINKQLNQYHDELGYSYSGILKSLVYFYDVKHNSTDKSNNAIGIVPFVYQDAYNYYYALFMAQNANADAVLTSEVKEYTIKPPKMVGTLHRLIDWSIDEDEE